MNDNNDFDSDWDDEECEWGELEEFDMPGINLDNKILSKRNFAIYDENEIDTIIMNEISNLSKTLSFEILSQEIKIKKNKLIINFITK